MLTWLSACGYRSGGRSALQMSLQECVTDLLATMKRQMMHSTGGWQKSLNFQPLYLWGTSACQMPAENTTQWRGGSLGDSWSVWRKNYSQLEKNSWVMWWSVAILGTATMKWWSFQFWVKWGKAPAELPPWISARQTLDCLGVWLTRVPWESVLKGKVVQEGQARFEEFLKVQQQIVLICCQGQRPVWINRELRLELRVKRTVSHLWKEGDNYKDAMRLCRRKSESQTNLIWHCS